MQPTRFTGREFQYEELLASGISPEFSVKRAPDLRRYLDRQLWLMAIKGQSVSLAKAAFG